MSGFHVSRSKAFRLLVAAALIGGMGAAGISSASAGGRSKDDRKAFWQTLHESRQPWGQMFHTQKTAPEKAPAVRSAKPKG